MLKLFVVAAVVWCINAKGIRLHLSENEHINPRSNDSRCSFQLQNEGWGNLSEFTFKLVSHVSDAALGPLIFFKWHLGVYAKHRDCADIKKNRPSSRDGVYTIHPDLKTSRTVFCDMTTDGGGWTVIQRRQSGKINFYRNWKDYKRGFGHINDEYWLGNDAIHALTNNRKQMLRIDLQKFSGEKAHATYSSFFVDNEAKKYKLTLGTFNGTKGLGDSLTYSNGAYFSTMDADYDHTGGSCAKSYKSGWWLKNCAWSNLNGLYGKGSNGDAKYIVWYHWGNIYQSLKLAAMMIRPKPGA